MRAQTVDVHEGAGRILSAAIFRGTGRKLMAKGHMLRPEDIRILESEGMKSIWVAELDAGEVHEDEAASQVAAHMACGNCEVQIVAGGRANLVATTHACILIDEELLRQVNCVSGVVVATTLNFSLAAPGQRIATVKSAPFAVPRSDFDAALQLLAERGPVIQARPVQQSTVGVVYCDPTSGERARTLFEPIVRQKLERFGIYSHMAIACTEEDEQVSRSIQHLLRSRVGGVIVASTTAPAGPEDAVGRAMSRIGCAMERYLAPVEPGHLLLLGYLDSVPVISAPGCFRSLKPNVVDLLIPPIMSRYRISRWEIASMGHGGLLQ